VETAPIFLRMHGPAGARDQVQAAGLVRTFLTHETRRTDVDRLDEPNAGERNVFLDAEPTDGRWTAAESLAVRHQA
jgi:hypothetical protein